MVEFTRLETASPKTYVELVDWHLECLDVAKDDPTRDVIFIINKPTVTGIRQFLESKKIFIEHIGAPSIGYGYSINKNNTSFNYEYPDPEIAVKEAIYAVFEKLGENPSAFF